MARFAPFVVIVTLAASSACEPRVKTALNVVPPLPTVPTPAPRCAESGQSAPLIVEWPSAERAMIESRAKAGLVLLRYKDCNIAVLSQCATKAKSAYAWVGTTRKRDRLVVTDRNELYANLPLGAATLEGTLARAKSLDVDMTVVGRYETDRGGLRVDDLTGDDCARATHVVTGITVGAFRFSAGTRGSASAGACVLGVKAGGSTSSTHEVLAEDGDDSACTTMTQAAATPPPNCAAPLRLDLVPIGTEKKSTPDCAPGTTWDGTKCKDAASPPIGCTVAEASLSVCSNRCAGDDATACVSLGVIYERRGEAAFAAAAYNKACTRNVGEGCSGLASMLIDGVSQPKDTPRAASLFERGCDLRHPEACTWLGHLHRMELIAGADATKATGWYTRGCDSGDSFACYWLADALLEGRGAPKDQGRAALILQRLCTQKHALSCMKLKSLGG